MNYNQQPGQFIQQQPMSTNNMQQQPMQETTLPDVTGKLLGGNMVNQYQDKRDGSTMYVFALMIEGQPGPIQVRAKSPTGPKELQEPGKVITISNIKQKGTFPPSGSIKRDFKPGGAGGNKGGNYLSVEQRLQEQKEIRKSGCNMQAVEILKLTGTKEKDADKLLQEVLRIGDALYNHISATQPQQASSLAPIPQGMVGLQSDETIG